MVNAINNIPEAKIFFIENKVDLESERVIIYEEAKEFAKDYNFLSFFETSSKTGSKTQKDFTNANIYLYEDYPEYKGFYSDSEEDNEKLVHD